MITKLLRNYNFLQIGMKMRYFAYFEIMFWSFFFFLNDFCPRAYGWNPWGNDKISTNDTSAQALIYD